MKRFVSILGVFAAITSLASAERIEAAGTAVGPQTLAPLASQSLPPDGGPGTFVIEAQGGPDFYVVAGVPSGDTLSIRSGPGTGNKIVARAPNGVVLRNLGCQGSGSARWCHVETRDGTIRGWVAGRYLRESGGGSAGGSSDVPELAVRNSGEIEVRWASGCTMLYNTRGSRINAGSSCTSAQRNRSDDAVDRYMREQGGGTAEGGGGPVNMRGSGMVTQGGVLLGRITSKTGRSYVLLLTAIKDGFTCTGTFDDAPGSRSLMSTVINCTNGNTGSAVLKGDFLTFSAGGKGGYVRF